MDPTATTPNPLWQGALQQRPPAGAAPATLPNNIGLANLSANTPMGQAPAPGASLPGNTPAASFSLNQPTPGIPGNAPPAAPGAAADDLGQPPLWTWVAGTAVGMPFAWFLSNYLFGQASDGGRYRIYKAVSFIDRIPGVSHISHGIDKVGEWFRGHRDGSKLPQILRKPVTKFARYADPYLKQFFHEADELDALKYHADDYLKMVEDLEKNQGKHTSGTLKNLRQRIDAHYRTARGQATPNTNQFYKNISTEMLRSARQVADEPTIVKQVLSPKAISALPDALRDKVEKIAQTTRNIDHARLKLAGLRMNNMFGFTAKGRQIGELMGTLKTKRTKVLQAQEKALLKQYLSPKRLNNANLNPAALQKLTQATTVAEAEKIIRPGVFGRMGSALTSHQRKALAQPLQALKNEVKLRKRLYGAYGRLQGLKQFHLNFYGQEREMSRDMRKVAGGQYNGKRIGIIGRTLATWAKALRDMIDGSVAGGGGGSNSKMMRWIPNAKLMVPAIFMGMFLMAPIHEAYKAEKGDKVKTFFYHLLGAELGMIIGWQVGSLLFNEIHMVPNLAKGIDKGLKKIGLKTNLRSSMFRFTKWPFFTLGGALAAFALPAFVTGSIFAKRGEQISNLIFGKPKSITELEHQEKLQQLTQGNAPGAPTTLPPLGQGAVPTPTGSPFPPLSIPQQPGPATSAPLPLTLPTTPAAPARNNPFRRAAATNPPAPPATAPPMDAAALEQLITQYTQPAANTNTHYGGLEAIDPSNIAAAPANIALNPRYA